LNADTDVEDLILQAAELYKLFVDEDKTIIEAFQSAFDQFIEDVKAYYGDTQAVSETKLLHELDKTELKMQLQIQKAEKKEQIENKKQATIQFVNAQKELNKIKNQIALAQLQLDGDDENLEILKSFELNLLKQTLFFTAQVDGESVSPQLLRSINDWAESEIQNYHKKNDGNGNSNGNDDKSNKGKGNSGNSGNGNSGNDNSNSGNDNSGNGNSSNKDKDDDDDDDDDDDKDEKKDKKKKDKDDDDD
jgi:hypothetical protein